MICTIQSRHRMSTQTDLHNAIGRYLLNPSPNLAKDNPWVAKRLACLMCASAGSALGRFSMGRKVSRQDMLEELERLTQTHRTWIIGHPYWVEFLRDFIMGYQREVTS